MKIFGFSILLSSMIISLMLLLGGTALPTHAGDLKATQVSQTTPSPVTPNKIDLRALTQVLEVAAARSVTSSLPFTATANGWRSYRNAEIGYRIEAPADAFVEPIDDLLIAPDPSRLPDEFDANVLPLAIKAAYGNRACISITYRNAFMQIVAAPARKLGLSCGPTGVGDFQLTPIRQPVTVMRQTVVGIGDQFSKGGKFVGELLYFDLPDGAQITFGTRDNTAESGAIYLKEVKPALLKVVQSYTPASTSK